MSLQNNLYLIAGRKLWQIQILFSIKIHIKDSDIILDFKIQFRIERNNFFYVSFKRKRKENKMNKLRWFCLHYSVSLSTVANFNQLV